MIKNVVKHTEKLDHTLLRISEMNRLPITRWARQVNIRSGVAIPLITVRYKNEIHAFSYLISDRPHFYSLFIHIHPMWQSSEEIINTSLCCSLIDLQYRYADKNLSIELRPPYPTFSNELTNPGHLGFIKHHGKWIFKTNSSKTKELRKIKDKLISDSKNFRKVGRGYLLDIKKYNPVAIEALRNEYHNIAWGAPNWAMNCDLAKDEEKLLDGFPHFDRAVEIGGGSGRITTHLCKKVSELWVTDYLDQIVIKWLHPLLERHPNLVVRKDNILKSNLKTGFFDAVFFLENGLGSLLSEKKRRMALLQCSRLLKPGGLLILGLREIPHYSGEQLMIASRYPKVMGIYHVFSKAESLSLACHPSLTLRSIIDGEPRPAGGRQFF